MSLVQAPTNPVRITFVNRHYEDGRHVLNAERLRDRIRDMREVKALGKVEVNVVYLEGSLRQGRGCGGMGLFGEEVESSERWAEAGVRGSSEARKFGGAGCTNWFPEVGYGRFASWLIAGTS